MFNLVFLRRRPTNSCTRREKQDWGEGRDSKGSDQTEPGRDEGQEDTTRQLFGPTVKSTLLD